MKRVKQIKLDIVIDDNTSKDDFLQSVIKALENNGYPVLWSEYAGDYTCLYRQNNLLSDENMENKKVLKVVDDALKLHGHDILSVDKEDDMLSVNICTTHYSDVYFASVARFAKCDIPTLKKELDRRDVGYCF